MVVKVLSPFLCVRQLIFSRVTVGGCLVVLNSKAVAFLGTDFYTILIIAGIPVVQLCRRMIHLFRAGQRGVRLEIG